MATTDRTLAAVLHQALRLDWPSSGHIQAENAERLVSHLGRGLHPARITASRIDELVVWLRQAGPTGRGCSNATVNRYLSALRVLLKRAQRMGLVDQLPLFPEKRQLKEAEPRELVLESDWIAELNRHLDPRDRPLITFLRWQGCRISEALNLTWDRVNTAHVQFVGTKGGKARRIPLFPGAAAALELRQGRLLPFGGESSYCRIRFRYLKAVAAACQALDLGQLTQDQWRIHTLRHTRLTELAQAGWSAPALQAFAGHSSLAVTQRYVHQSAVNLDSLVASTPVSAVRSNLFGNDSQTAEIPALACL